MIAQKVNLAKQKTPVIKCGGVSIITNNKTWKENDIARASNGYNTTIFYVTHLKLQKNLIL